MQMQTVKKNDGCNKKRRAKQRNKVQIFQKQKQKLK